MTYKMHTHIHMHMYMHTHALTHTLTHTHVHMQTLLAYIQFQDKRQAGMPETTALL